MGISLPIRMEANFWAGMIASHFHKRTEKKSRVHCFGSNSLPIKSQARTKRIALIKKIIHDTLMLMPKPSRTVESTMESPKLSR